VTSEIRVLHVDDEPIICDLTKMCLEKEGRFKVDVAHSAEEALERIRSGMYSCIISDYEMPLMNGIDLLKAVRNIDHDIPFILFSGRGRETVIIDAINTGADFYIQKGGEPKALFAELNHKVEYAIEQRNTRIALKRRDSILEAVSLVANLFLGKEDFDKVLQEAITLFGLATEVDTVRLFKFESNDDPLFPCIIKNIASWTRVAIHCDMREAFLKNETIPIKQELMTRLVSGETVILKQEEIRAYDPVKNDECAKSIAVFPVFVDQKAWGVVWFADYLGMRTWTGVEIDALLAASAIIGSALCQDQMRRSLVAAKEEYASMYSLMRRLCDTVPDILWAKDLEGKFLFVNQAGCTLLGASNTDEPIGKNEDNYSKWLFNHHNGLFLSRSLPNLQGRITVPIGTEMRELDVITVPFIDTHGVIIGTVTLGRDITNLCRVEEGLFRSEQRSLNVLKSIHIGILIVSKDGLIKEINPRAMELLQIAKQDVCGLSVEKIQIMHNIGIMRAISDAITTGKTISFLVLGRMAGTGTDLYCTVRLLVPENEEIAEVLITLDPHYTA